MITIVIPEFIVLLIAVALLIHLLRRGWKFVKFCRFALAEWRREKYLQQVRESGFRRGS